MTFLGDFTPEGNFAEKIDRFVLGRFRDGVSWADNGVWSFSPRYQYTWIISSLTFGVTVLMGTIAGGVMKNGSNRNKNALTLLIAGVACIAVSLLWGLQMPIIKKIWTCSMTLYSGGWCLLLMALFYFVIDCKGYSKGVNWLKIYGMNSITAYVLGQVVNFRSVVDSVFHGLAQFMGPEYYKVWLTFGNFMILFIILHILYKRGIFLRV
jgi:predicted acyltransferase